MSIELLMERRTDDLGGGSIVGRVLPFAKRRIVGPYIFWDHVGRTELEAGFPKVQNVRPQPSTFTRVRLPIAAAWVASRTSARGRSTG